MSQPKSKVDARSWYVCSNGWLNIVTYEEFNVDNLSVHVGDIPARQPIPGVVSYISGEAVEEGIKSTLELALYPVVLQPTRGYRSLNDAHMNTSIPPNDKGKAIIQPYLC